jgi:hypothetical protein
MRINKKLNLVIPVTTQNHGKIFVHSVPIGRDVFETYYFELGQVFDECFSSDNPSHTALSAPQIAYPALKKVARQAGTWENEKNPADRSGVKFGLCQEIIRLTNVVFADESGWKALPLSTIIARDFLDEDEEAEVMSALIFFTSISLAGPKELRTAFLEMSGRIRGWELTLSDCMVYMTGLTTLTETETTQEKATA